MSNARAPHIPKPSATTAQPAKLRVGRAGDQHEQAADRSATQAVPEARGQSLGGASQSAPGTRAPTPAQATSGGGKPLDDTTRMEMETRLGHDFRNVRVHADGQAADSAQALGARAYAVNDHVVFNAGQFAPEKPAGKHLLAHELTHVAQQRANQDGAQGTVQRAGFFESLARFFGGGTFSEDELDAYLLTLESGQIEGDNDSDNKARAIVAKGKHKGLSIEVRALLIEEMFSGFTGNDDEQAILRILKEATPLDREVIVERVGIDRLNSELHGDENDQLQGLLGRMKRAGKQPLPTDWMVSYSVHGAEELRERAALWVEQFDITPDAAGAETQNVVMNEPVNSPTGSAQKLAGGVDHPRGAGGSGNVALQLATPDADGKIEKPSTPPVVRQAEYAPLSYDKHRVEMKVDVEFERAQTGSTTRSKEQETETRKEVEHGKKESKSQTETTGTKQGTSTTESRGVEVSQGASKTDSKSDTQSETKGENESTTKGTGKSTTESDSTSKTKGSSESKTTSESKSTTEGKSETESSTTETSVNFHAEGKLDADLKDLVSGLGGKLVSGGILGKLLGKAGKIGGRLLGLARKLGKLNVMSLLLELLPDDTFKLSGTLKGDLAKKWIETESTTESSGTTETESSETTKGTNESETKTKGKESTTSSNESTTKGTSKESGTSSTTGTSTTQSADVKQQAGKATTKSSETSKETAKTTGTETSTATRKSDAEREMTGTAETAFVLKPVIKNATIQFVVRK